MIMNRYAARTFLQQCIHLKVFKSQHVIQSLSKPTALTSLRSYFKSEGIHGNNPSKEITIPLTYGNISGKAWGCETALPVLALHGWMDNCGSFDKLIPLLSDKFYFVAIDSPGHGESSHLPPGCFYTDLSMVLDFKKVTDHLGWKKFHLLGHSMGGLFALQFSAMFPDSVVSCISIDSAKPFSAERDQMHLIKANAIRQCLEIEKKLLGPPSVYSVESASAKWAKSTLNEMSEEAFELLLKRGTRQSECGKGVVFTRDLRLLPLKYFAINIKYYEDVEAHMGNVRCKLLLIMANGSHRYFQPETTEALERLAALYQKNASRFVYDFSINLQTGDNTYQRSDIALHLSPVFSSPPRLVRNSLEKQNWGPEESHGPFFPLVAGQSFEILILAGAEDFKVAINGQHFTEFQHRLPLQSISHIAIDGEVTINHIKFEGLTKSPMASGSGEGISKPLGFVIDPSNPGNTMTSPSGGRAPSPYGSSNLPYPPSPSFGPSPTPYAPPSDTGYAPNALSPNSPYAPYNPYGPQQSGRVSPNPYGLPPAGNPYGPPPGNPYPQGYPQQQGPYPSQGYPGSNPYPSQPGPYPGTHVEYPGQQKKSEGSGGMNLGPLAAAGAAALAGVAGSSLLGGKKHKKKKHGHGIPGMLGHGAGPAALIGGMSSLLGGNKHGGHHKGSSSIPIGGAVAAGATGLAGAYMMNKVLKPKKMFKHKHKGWGSSSSSSSSSSD
ncbi:hypothetical protein JTE90_020838 [Oedothorax gibbosus]|uniref:Galectin domain-containing protein n=1 Tax=Oedothorax gibbosus TaxID=931172 RepID=A0AAV6U113_9ARAC|nr:hypothetical protein JTE90_020838 [Oedothorax gibbosus]